MMKRNSSLLLLVFMGCGGSGVSMGDVSGSVTLDGKPVEEAVITFTSSFARAARGKIVDGQIIEVTTFELNDGVPVGQQRVSIKPSYKPVLDLEKAGKIRPVTAIPAKYSELARTQLTADIAKGENALSFELTSK